MTDQAIFRPRWLDRVRGTLTRWQQDRARRRWDYWMWDAETDQLLYRPRSWHLRLGCVQVWVKICPFQVFISTNAPVCAACQWTHPYENDVWAWPQPDRWWPRRGRVRLCELCTAALLDPRYRDYRAAGVDWTRLEQLTFTPPSQRPRFAEPYSTAAGLLADIDADIQFAEDGPRVVCLCGSTRFMDAFHAANRRETLAGRIVLTVELVTYDGATDPQRADPEQKARLDELHLRKIDLADEVLVLNVGGYIGESTRREIAYAHQSGIPVRYLEPPATTKGGGLDG